MRAEKSAANKDVSYMVLAVLGLCGVFVLLLTGMYLFYSSLAA